MRVCSNWTEERKYFNHEINSWISRICRVPPKALYDRYIYLPRLLNQLRVFVSHSRHKCSIGLNRWSVIWNFNRYSGVKPSPGNQGVFQLLKEVTFRRIRTFCRLWERWGFNYETSNGRVHLPWAEREARRRRGQVERGLGAQLRWFIYCFVVRW